MAQVSFQDAGGRLYGEMQKCIIYIQNHPDQDITMEDLAGRMAYAPIQLSYLFDLFFEKSFIEHAPKVWYDEKKRSVVSRALCLQEGHVWSTALSSCIPKATPYL